MADRGETPAVKARARRARPKGKTDAGKRSGGELPAAKLHAGELYASVAAGSVIGSVLRWLVGLALPWATLFVNLTGSFAIGFFAAMSAPGGRWFVGPRMRQFFMTGICGGYTTFSMFSLETLRLLQQGKLIDAAGYIALSLVAWCAAVWFGDALAMRLNRLKGA